MRIAEVHEDLVAARAVDIHGPASEAQPPVGDNADGVKLAEQILASATNARWLLYLRSARCLVSV